MSDDDRDLLLDYDELVCPRCGNLRETCANPDIDWHPHLATCYASATVEWGWRRLRKKYPADREKSLDALHPLDGSSVFSAQIEPVDDPFILHSD